MGNGTIKNGCGATIQVGDSYKIASLRTNPDKVCGEGKDTGVEVTVKDFKEVRNLYGDGYTTVAVVRYNGTDQVGEINIDYLLPSGGSPRVAGVFRDLDDMKKKIAKT